MMQRSSRMQRSAKIKIIAQRFRFLVVEKQCWTARGEPGARPLIVKEDLRPHVRRVVQTGQGQPLPVRARGSTSLMQLVDMEEVIPPAVVVVVAVVVVMRQHLNVVFVRIAKVLGGLAGRTK